MNPQPNSQNPQVTPETKQAAPPPPPRQPIAAAPGQATASGGFSWTASEFIEHHKSSSWYLMLVGATAALAGLVYLVTKDKIAAGVIVILGVIVGYYAGHKPRQLSYELNDTGLRIGDKLYPYANFKSFSIIRDGALSSIQLTPLKRFMPPVAAYFDPDEEQSAIGAIEAHLPYEEGSLDVVERLTRRLRF
jgi:hypothetical protein